MNQLKYDDKDIASILNYASKLKGKTIGEISEEILVRFSNNKGGIGQYIEKNYFGIDNNSLQEPDFIHVGMELKVTPLKKIKNGNLRAKERLVLTLINYENDYNLDFYSSHLYNKMKHILIVTYLYEKDEDSNNFKIIDTFEYKIPEEDLPTILEDYEIVLNLISQGKAHEISESLTTYLGACTKGANGEALRIQPNSDIMAKQRAWSLKPSYMNYYYDKIKANKEEVSIAKGTKQSLNVIIHNKLSNFYGKSEKELFEMFGIQDNTSKNKYQLLASAMFGIVGTKLENTSEFQKSNIKLKTVRVEQNGSIREDMSFETIKYTQLATENTFEESEIYKIFGATSYLVMFFRKNSDGEYYFEKYSRWSLTYDDLLDVERYWKELKAAISQPIKIQPFQQKDDVIYKYITFPTSGENKDRKSVV